MRYKTELYDGRPEDMLKYPDIEPGAVSIMGLVNDKDHEDGSQILIFNGLFEE